MQSGRLVDQAFHHAVDDVAYVLHPFEIGERWGEEKLRRVRDDIYPGLERRHDDPDDRSDRHQHDERQQQVTRQSAYHSCHRRIALHSSVTMKIDTATMNSDIAEA